MTVIDADAHVIETERTWDFLEESEREFRPQLLIPKNGGPRPTEYWMVEGRVIPRNINIMAEAPEASRDMADVAHRLAHMDELGVDMQVLYPTFFLTPLTRRPEVDVALCRAYNRWMADLWKVSKGRLPWVLMPPLLNMEKALEELHFGKAHGAVAVYFHGMEWDHRLSDPHFFPLYQEAGRLNLTIAVHSANNNFAVYDLYLRDSGLSTFKLPVVGAFHDLIMKGVPAKFPDLRWAFVEVSAQWVPYILRDMGIRLRKQGVHFVHADILRENRIWVACQTDDDLDYVLRYAGEDNLLLGTDYGHNDTASEMLALRKLKEDGKVPARIVDKILGDNAKAAYSL